jgi:hypothetical protein
MTGYGKLKLSRWKDVAEIVALAAIVGGLIAVVMELRQTQTALRAQAYQARAMDVMDALRVLTSNPELEILTNKFLTKKIDMASASPEEQSQLRIHFYARRTDLDNEHYQFQSGFLDADFYHTTTEREIKAFAPYWRALGIPEPRQQFVKEVDRILADPNVTSALDWTAASGR